VRATVDVVVPFVGGAEERRAVLARVAALGAERVVLVDNGATAATSDDPRVLRAPDRPSSYFARNRGAAAGDSEWIVFLDDDTEPAPDLLERYFSAPIGERVAVLAGGVRDEVPGDVAALPLAARFAALRGPMDQSNTLHHAGGRWGYAQTANAAVRRAAFEEVGGFEEGVRSGGDADLCFRLRAAGWELEERADAWVTHRNRTTLWALARQRARHGAGAEWLNTRYPGSFPPDRGPRRTVRSLRQLGRAGIDRARGDRDAATLGFVGVVFHWSFELGRFAGNEVAER
jgi:cellulose synthase/poly-beta-1,6-N-acetylglucosamine synthase-like glycosyltransferase